MQAPSETLNGPDIADQGESISLDASHNGEQAIKELESQTRDGDINMEAPDAEDIDEGAQNGGVQHNEDTESNTDTKKTALGSSERAFKGDWNFVELYNEHVEDFFSMKYAEIPKRRCKRSLQDSKITTERAYYRPQKILRVEEEDPDYLDQVKREEAEFHELSVGTLWTGEEKEVFFKCLARFTIHRVDEFLQYLPHKSIGEIIAYYELLERELRSYRSQQSHTVQIKDKSLHDSKVLRHKYDIVTVPGGISHTDLPIAYEMSEEWIDFEEDQSILIADRERRLDIDRGKQETKLMKEYVGKKRGEETPNEDSSTPLIDVNNAFKVGKIYRGNQITMIQDRKQAPRLLFQSLVYLEEITYLVTKRIIASLVSNKGFSNPADEIGIKVMPSDIWNAVRDSRICEAPKSGMAVERIWKGGVLEGYWEGLPLSLRLVTDNPSVLTATKTEVQTAPSDLHGVFLTSELRNLDTYPDALVEEGAYGKLLDEDGEEVTESYRDSEESDNEEESFENLLSSPTTMQPQLGTPQAIVVPLEPRITEQSAVNMHKNATDIVIDDVLIDRETKALEEHDEAKHEALNQAQAGDYEGFSGSIAQLSDRLDSTGSNGSELIQDETDGEEEEIFYLAGLQDAWNRH